MEAEREALEEEALILGSELSDEMRTGGWNFYDRKNQMLTKQRRRATGKRKTMQRNQDQRKRSKPHIFLRKL